MILQCTAGSVKFTAFADLRFTIGDEIAEADTVAVRWTSHGTHRGELIGIPPTSKPVTVTGMMLARLCEGRVADNRTNFDALGMLQQIGAMPAAGQVPA